MDSDDRTYIAVLYHHLRAEGRGRADAAQQVWLALRTTPGYKHLRAPYWSEKLHRNGSSVRSYRSPLGDVLGVTGEFGRHCARWPRTVRSEAEAANAAARVLDALDAMVAA